MSIWPKTAYCDVSLWSCTSQTRSPAQKFGFGIEVPSVGLSMGSLLML